MPSPSSGRFGTSTDVRNAAANNAACTRMHACTRGVVRKRRFALETFRRMFIIGAAGVVGAVSVPAGAQQAIIIDHKCTNIAAIPADWIEAAKLLTIHYAHTSHGGQIVSGLAVLEGLHPEYSFARRESGTEGLPAIETPPALRMYDGNPPETYIEPNDYWDGESAKNRTRAVAATGRYSFSMWSWCGQQSSNSQATTQRYLDTMAQFEGEFPGMRFILMTGHTDGSGETGTLNIRNNQVRQYCIDHGMVLFDFADIESYDPDRNYYLDRGCNDYCNYNGGNWANEWCAAHPGHELCTSCSCAHSLKLNCNLKARAFWWMMARLAGWAGPPRADLDEDGDVDEDDFDQFQACTTGAEAGPVASGCGEADFDGDDDVDQTDFGLFQRCLAGPDTPADEDCVD